jgi:hypothetical protein
MQIAGAKGVHLQGQPGAGPRLTLLGLLLGSVWGFVRGQVRPTNADRAAALAAIRLLARR